jgi:hypothetical protein
MQALWLLTINHSMIHWLKLNIMETNKSDVLIMSRISFCQKCYERNSPSKGDLCAIWHTTHSQFIIHKVTGRTGTRGYVPHIYVTNIPVPQGSSVKSYKSCGICDCSVTEPDEESEDQRYGFEIVGATEVTLPKSEWIALWKKFKNTGYEVE